MLNPVAGVAFHLFVLLTCFYFYLYFRQCVFDVDRVGGKLTLLEVADGVTVEEVRKKTGCDFDVCEGGPGKME